MAFRGHYEHNLDAKNRLTVPSKFRAALADGAVLGPGFDSCMTVWPAQGWDEWTERQLGSLNPFDKRARDLRHFFSLSYDQELDSAGRIALPPPLIEHAGLAKDVVVVGERDHLEVWDAAAWQQRYAQVSASILDTAQELAASLDASA